MKNIPRHILISRTDSIGDVVLTLPVAAAVKKQFPQVKIGFLGKAYTKPVIEACKNVDCFIDMVDFMHTDNISICGQKPDTIIHVFPVAAIAKRAKQMAIPLRIGTTNRLFHWYTCNNLVKLSRKNSSLHEAQLNLKLLEPLGMDTSYSLAEIGGMFGLEKLAPISEKLRVRLAGDKYNLILHPKSQGSAREWGIPNFIQLIQLLDKNKFRIFISGTEKERALLQPIFDVVGKDVEDITGLMQLAEFISFISLSDGLVANSTGPLHIASALGINAIGIYPPIRPIHPGRWAPLGVRASVLVLEKNCTLCKTEPANCSCIAAIKPMAVIEALNK